MLRKPLFLLTLFFIHSGFAQNNNDSIPAESFIPTVTEFYNLNIRLKSNIESISIPQKNEAKKIYQHRKSEIEKALKKGEYLSIEFGKGYIEEIYQEILQQNPSLTQPDLLLIDRDWIPNAYCTSEGIIALNLGLLHRLENQSQIAFVLAHELAHGHLDHVNKHTEDMIKSFSKKELKRGGHYEDLSKGDVSAIKSLIYKTFNYSKKSEEQADSMALELIKNTRFDFTAYREVMSILDSAKYPKYQDLLELRNWLFYDEYPFKEKWLRPVERSGLYNENAPSFIFSKDSLATHPDVEYRSKLLDSLFSNRSLVETNNEYSAKSQRDSHFQFMVDKEIIYSTLFNKEFAVCLYYLSARMKKFPGESWHEAVLGKLFYELYQARKSHTFGKQVPSTVPAGHWLEETVTFLNNVRMSEYKKLTFWQFYSRTKIEELDEGQHFAFWEVSKGINDGLQHSLKESYFQRFPDGEYVDQFQTKE